MQMRREEVAVLANVSVDQVLLANVGRVREKCADQVPAIVLEVATQEPAFYWEVGEDFYLDDAMFGDVVNFKDLRYNEVYGLYDKKTLGEK